MKLRTTEKISPCLSWRRRRRGAMLARRFWKRRANKLMRLMERESPEDAPRRHPVRGWND